MGDASDFRVFSWSRPFLPALKDFIDRETGGQPGKAIIIVPNQRPWRHFASLYAKDAKAGAMPRMLPLARLVSMWSAAAASSARAQASPLDRISILRECVMELAPQDASLAAQLAGMDEAAFLPWGMRAVALLEEIFTEGAQPSDMANLEDAAPPLAAALLGALGRIAVLYRQKLAAARLSTPGLDSLIAAENVARIPLPLSPRTGRPIFIAGFSELDGTADKLFKGLWQRGAIVCLHGDPALAEGGEAHSACSGQAAWMRGWGARAALIGDGGANQPSYSFYAGYDRHSQLRQLAADVKEAAGSGSNAIVLPDAGLLMPALHELPGLEVNISMGYPIKRARLRSLLDDMFRLHLTKAGDGRFYWRDLLRLLGQPYLAMITSGADPKLKLSQVARRLSRQIRRGGRKYVSLSALKSEYASQREAEAGAASTAAELALFDEAAAHLINALGQAAAPGAAAGALAALVNYLVEKGGAKWRQAPLDVEAISRLKHSVLPVLANSRMRNARLPLNVIFRLLDMLLEQERIPFEAEPLTGAQMIGLLETRLLDFDNVYILDASNDILPGDKAQDPLLPDSLRGLAGLPDSAQRRRIVEHYLFRLLQGAKNARFYWSEGAMPDGAGQKERSCFVERLIWEEEQRRGRVLEPGDPPLALAESFASLSRRNPKPIHRDAALSARMSEILGSPLSPTSINDYLSCPASFAMSRLMRLSTLGEVNEGDDLPRAGTCIHEALAEFLEPCLGKSVKLALLGHAELERIFAEKLGALEDELPVDSYMVLERGGIKAIKEYLRRQKDETLIEAIEAEASGSLDLNGRRYEFAGRIDRVDERGGRKWILDYKTGNLHKPKPGVWQDSEFFGRLAAYCQAHEDFDAEADALLDELRARLPDIQLPLYALLVENVADAAFIDLKGDGKEHPVFGALDAEQLALALGHCKTALGFILLHMEKAPEFRPAGRGCDYCGFARACSI